MWPLFHAIWSTPYNRFLVQYGVLLDLAQRSIYVVTWSTPYGCFLIPYGVLHMASLWCHMEHIKNSHMDHFVRHQKEFYKANSKALHMAPQKCHMEYSIWQQYKALWSTPQNTINKSYGALCIYSKKDIDENNMKYSIWRQISATWSTPYGLKKMAYGALHMTLERVL